MNRRLDPHTPRRPRGHVDLGLAVLQTLPRRRWTLESIAAVCGVRKSTIYMLERRALIKLRRRADYLIKLSRLDRPTFR